MGVDVLLHFLYNATRAVLQGRRWATAFEKAGLGYRQLGVAPHVLRHLQLQSPPAVPSTRPTDEQLQACFPRRTEIHSRAAVLWWAFVTGRQLRGRMVSARRAAVACWRSQSGRARGATTRARLELSAPRGQRPLRPPSRLRQRHLWSLRWPAGARFWCREVGRFSFAVVGVVRAGRVRLRQRFARVRVGKGHAGAASRIST